MIDQEKAFAKLSRLKVGALFMEMGTGKTKVALDLIASKRSKIDFALWICPFSIKGEIEAERKKWHPELPFEIVGCETIGSSDRTFIRLLSKVKSQRSFIVVDESLKIKNLSAKRTNRILAMGKFAEYKLILNGTPLSRNVLDLYPQMEFLSHKILGMSYNQFRNNYCEYYVRGRLKNKVKRQCNIPHLVSMIRPYVFDSELDLGANKHYYDYEYKNDDVEGYEAIKRSFFGDGDLNFYRLSTKLQEHYCASKDRERVLSQLLSSIEGQSIVYVKFLASIPEGERSLTGKSSEEDRKRTLVEFKDGKFDRLWITYGCGSLGLNLQFCRNIVFLEHSFDYAQRIQAEARIYRIGQESDVNYYDVRCDVGLERMIVGCLGKKKSLLGEIKEEIERKGVEGWLRSM